MREEVLSVTSNKRSLIVFFNIKWKVLYFFRKLKDPNYNPFSISDEEADQLIEELFSETNIIPFIREEDFFEEYIEEEPNWIYSFPRGCRYLEGSYMDLILSGKFDEDDTTFGCGILGDVLAGFWRVRVSRHRGWLSRLGHRFCRCGLGLWLNCCFCFCFCFCLGGGPGRNFLCRCL